MRKYLLLLLTPLLMCGCGGGSKPGLTDAELERIVIARRIELVEVEGGLELMVGDETVTSDQTIAAPVEYYGMVVPLVESLKPIAKITSLERFKEQSRKRLEEMVTAEISNILLYQHAKEEVGENADAALEQAAESELRRFVLEFEGDQARADEVLREQQMDRESFKEQRKRAILIQWYADSKLPKQRPVTYRDLLDHYNQMKDEYFAKAGMIKLRLIDIRPASVAVQDPNEDPRQLAEKQAYELLTRIEAGEDFGELAKKYSHGDWREFGGLWRPVRPESLAPPYDILAAEAERIQQSQVVGPIAVPGHVFIMKLEEKQSAGYEPFENVQGQIEQKLIFDRRNEIFDRLNARMMQQVELGETDKFIDFCLEKIYLMSNR